MFKIQGDYMLLENEFGKLSITTEGNLSAGGYSCLEFKLTPCNEMDFNPRTIIEIVQFTRFFSNQWSIPQVTDPTAPGYVTAGRSDGGFLDVNIKRTPPVYFRHGSTFHVIQVALGGSPLEKGGSIIIKFGNKAGGSVGVKAPLISKDYFFPVYISQRHVLGSIRFREAEAIPFDNLFAIYNNVSYDIVKNKAVFCPVVRIVAGEPAKLNISASTREKNFKVFVSINDIYGNVCDYINTSAVIEGESRVSIEGGYGKTDVVGNYDGIKRLKCECAELGLYGISNPVSLDYKVAFGEIHCHSSISDGLGTDEDNYNSGIKAGLDFGALSDHDTLMKNNDSKWVKTIKNASKFNNEPDFITLLGYEALTFYKEKTAGHINLYYPGSDGVMIPVPDLSEIPDICKKNNALAIPHHTMYGGQFFGNMGLRLELMKPEIFSEDFMPVVEIYSTHGNSETAGCEKSVLGVNPESSVTAALDKGFKWGFIGGSDNHESLLGHKFRVDKIPRTVNNEHMQFRHGLTAVYLDERTRNNLFTSIKNRSVYATTGERILLYIEINGNTMGSEFAIDSRIEHRDIEIVAAGTSKIERIDIIRNGKTISRREPGTLDCEIYFVDEEPLEKDSYYYVKVVQTDGEIAWSSPIWINTNN